MARQRGNNSKTIGRGRAVAGDILIVLALAFTVYLAAVMLHRIGAVVTKRDYINVFRYELILCAAMIAFALDVRTGFFTRARSLPLRILGWALRGIVVLLTAGTLALFAKVVCGGLVRSAETADSAIVLGMALEDGQPTKDLLFRTQAAEDYARAHPDSRLIVTGGNAADDGRTEAAVMRDILTEHGVAPERIVTEDAAYDTNDNFRNTAELIDPAAPVVIVTSDYHMGRAVRIARDAGFSAPLRLPARSEALYYAANVMWEVIAELNHLVYGR